MMFATWISKLLLVTNNRRAPRTDGLLCLAVCLCPQVGYAQPDYAHPGWPQSGGPQGVELTELYSLRGDEGGSRFGAALSGVGDVDGDGVSDWIVGEPNGVPGASGGPGASGLVIVYSGADRRELHRISGPAGSRFGSSVGCAGDVDQDGHADFIVGAPQNAAPAGMVQIFSGATGSPLRTWHGDAPGDRFGHAAVGLGDLNGDGVGDLIISAPHADVGALNSGSVRVYSGRDGALLWGLDGSSFDLLGLAVAAVDDVDGDGKTDVLVGAPLADGAAFNGGSAYLLSGVDGSLVHTYHGTGIGDQLGTRLSAAGDVDGDGLPDCLLGVPGADGGGIDAGAVQVYSGRTGVLIHTVIGGASSEYLHACAPLADVDGDGLADYLVGAASSSAAAPQAGQVRLISGATGADLVFIDGLRADDWFGATIANLGDLNGDGRPEFACAAPVHDDNVVLVPYVRVFTTR